MSSDPRADAIKREVLKRYNVKRLADKQPPAERLSRQIRALIDVLIDKGHIK